jgi:hypothetical protein
VSPVEIAEIVRRRLAAELDDERVVLDGLAQAIERLLPPTDDARGEWMRALALAFEVDRWYTAAESSLVRALRTLDGAVPTGANWRADVLRAAAVEVEGCRPALVTHETLTELRELLRFRHLARHGYEREPDLALMSEHAARVARAHQWFNQSLDALGLWLRGGASGERSSEG